MNKYIIITLVFILVSCITNKQSDRVFSLHFACCFRNENVSLFIDEKLIFENLNISSDSVLSLTGITAVYRKDKKLRVYNGNDIFYNKELHLTKFVDVMIVIDSDTLRESVNISKGKNLLVNRYNYNYEPEIQQFKKKIILY